ncbi:MAG: serine protease [Firmicutes bacterium]|nr:serine protease [Bacillota bacterium]
MRKHKKTPKSHEFKFVHYLGTLLLTGIALFFITVIGNMASDYIRSQQTQITTTSITTVSTESFDDLLNASRRILSQANVYLQINLEGEIKIGSGTIIFSDEEYYYALTCEHVIDGDVETIVSKQVMTIDEVITDFEVVASDSDLDLAVIKFSKESRINLFPLLFHGGEPSINETILSIGNPLGNYNYLTIGSYLGETTLLELDLSRLVIQTNAYLPSGFSGGAMTNLEGELIGINAWALNGESYSIPVSVIHNYLQQIGISHY